jgi:DNA modification methylase
VTTQVNLAWDAVELDTIAAQEGIDLPDWGLDPKDLGIAQEQEPQEAQEDDFDEEKDPVATICQEGDVWQLGEHRLMCGDSTDAENVRILLDGQKADLCFTDPPYGVSYTGGIQFKADGSVERNNREMIANDDIDIYAQVFEVLKDFVNGPCYVWFADSKAASLYAAAEKYGEIHALLIWVKNGGYGALNANYKQKHEPCLYWKPKGSTLNFIGATTETTIWEINKDGKNEYHPTQKPVALPAKAINNHKCDIVLDLFGGSGSTLIACEQLHRKARLMELDPHYCDVIIARWEKLTGQKAIKL